MFFNLRALWRPPGQQAENDRPAESVDEQLEEIKPPEIQLPASLWVHEFTDGEISRYALGGIRFDFAAGVVAATDGRVLLRRPVDLSAFSGHRAVVLDAEDLATAIRVAKGVGEHPPPSLRWLFMTCRGGAYAIDIRDPGDSMRTVATVPWRVLNGLWPDEKVEQLLGDEETPSHEILLNASLLRVVADYYARADPEDIAVRVRIAESGRTPVRLSAQGADVLLMPMKDASETTAKEDDQ